MWRWLGKVTQKPEVVFLVVASVFGIFSAIFVPQLSIPDENMHFLRSYTMSTGHITGDKDNKCIFPKDVYSRAYSIYDGDYSSHYSQKINFDSNQKEWCGTAASYSPFIYIPHAVGFFVAKVIWPSTGLMILFGRLASLILFIVATFYTIRHVRIGKWVFVVVALFPTVIQQVASLSADSFTYAALFAAVAFFLNLSVQKSRFTWRQAITLLLLSAALILSKVPDVVIILLLLFLPNRLFRYKLRNIRILKPFVVKLCLLFASALFALLAAYLWQTIYGQSILTMAQNNPIPGQPWKFLPILFHTFVYMDPKATTFGFTGLGGFSDFLMSGAVGSFASYRYWLPQILVFLCYGLLLLTLLRPDKKEDKLLAKNSGWLAVGSIVTLGIFVVAITYSLYVIWALPLLGKDAIFAAGLQGRYFTAAFVLLIPVGILIRKYVYIKVKSDALFRTIVIGTSCFILLFYALQTLYVIHLGFFH